MFDISLSEILLTAVVALLVFSPKQIPQLAGKLGRWIKLWQNYLQAIKQDVYRHSSVDEILKIKSDVLNHTQQDEIR